MPLPTFNRFADLRARKIVNSRAQLENLKRNEGFPPGRLLSPNTRVWDEQEILDWLNSRPTAQADPDRFRDLGQASTAARKGKSPKVAKAAASPSNSTEAA
jgi:predicted DNA-binding transcriptional regulator AlpA